MFKWVALFFAVVVAAFALMENFAGPPAQPPQLIPAGPYVIVPTTTSPRSNGMQSWSVWLLDTKGGELEFCTYTLEPVEGGEEHRHQPSI
jgi:hypothetical protein